MAVNRQDLVLNESLGERRGFPVYVANPSALEVKLKTKENEPIRIDRGANATLINSTTGEVLGEGTLAFFRRKVVDDEQFVKIFSGGIKKFFELSKSAQKIVSQIILPQIQENKDQDKIELVQMLYKDLMPERTFQRAIRELLKKELIYMTPSSGVFFINMKVFFNGTRVDRVVEAVEYVRASAINQPQQLSLLSDGSND